jgi:TatD DNase family protein
MVLTDTHTHLYLEEFDDDRDEVIQRALDAGVEYMLLPNIDNDTVEPMLTLCGQYPGNLFPMMGLHPTDVKENFETELQKIEDHLKSGTWYGIGETGMDLYWDKTFVRQQEMALREQIEWAKKYNLPIVIHSRDSFDEIFRIIDDTNDERLRGVFHCFTGTEAQARKILEYGGFYLGIGGVLTFKNSGLDKVAENIPLEKMLLETDSPFLAPKPFRGKRNESARIRIIAEKLAEVKNVTPEEVAEQTTANAIRLFKFK